MARCGREKVRQTEGLHGYEERLVLTERAAKRGRAGWPASWPRSSSAERCLALGEKKGGDLLHPFIS